MSRRPETIQEVWMFWSEDKESDVNVQKAMDSVVEATLGLVEAQEALTKARDRFWAALEAADDEQH